MSFLLAALLAGSMLVIAKQSNGSAAPPSPVCASSAGDSRAAHAMAMACAARVEVEAERTEYQEVFAEPNGGQTVVASLVPQRARRLDGTWGQIDTSLRMIDGRLAPWAAASHVRFSAGGTGPLASLTHEGHRFELSWPAPLPAPLVTGDTATYPEVLPGADVVVRATHTGFSHLLVVKNARAAANPAVREARYLLGGDATLSSTSEGGLIAEAGGVRVATAQQPVMWDTPGHDSARELAMAGVEAQQPRKYATVTHKVSNGQLVLSADAAMLADPAARFPLIIDPLFVTGQVQWAYATSTNENGPTTDSTIASGDPSPAAAALRVGNDPETSRTYRSFFRFPTSTFHGKQVLTAKISGRADHTWKCTENRSNYFYRTGAIAATPRQTWPGPQLQLRLGNNSVHANEDSCSDPNDPFEVSTTTLVNDVQEAADGAYGNYYYVGVSAGENTSGLNETTQDRWMRYFLADFKLHVTYNSKPNKPDTLTVDGKACASGANKPFVKTTTPTLRARVTDPDGDTMDAYFIWAKWNGTAFVDEPGSGIRQDSVPHGATALKTVTAAVDGATYTFRAQSNDSPSHSPFLWSDFTHVPGNCEWQVDMTPPATPAITADIYKEGPTGCPGGACGSVGRTGRFTFTSSADTKSFLWGFSDPPTHVLNPATLGGSVSLDWTPPSSGPKTLYVKAVDRAGWETTKVYQFYVAAESAPVARWHLNEPAGATTLADDTGNGHSLTLLNGAATGAPGRLMPGNDGVSRTVLALDGVDDRAETATQVIFDTAKSWSVAAWVKLRGLGTNHSVMSQGGTNQSAFWMDFKNGGFQMTVSTGDTLPADYWSARATTVPRVNTWMHVAGVYDSAAETLKIYINGVLEATTTGVVTWDANGPFRIGGFGSSFNGWVEGARVWNRVLFDSEVPNLVDPTKVGKVAEWRLEEVGPGPAFDSSTFAHDLTFFNGASIPPSGAGQTGTGLRLDGLDDYVAPGEPVLNTDQSFTVSMWARPATLNRYQALLAQESTGTNPGFLLYYAGSDTAPEWKFKMYASAASDETTVTLTTTAATALTAYHHLVGVFDAQRRELRLYVDGVLKATTAMNGSWQPWPSTGRLLIGRTHSGASPTLPTHGDVDEVRIYQGVVTDVTRIP